MSHDDLDLTVAPSTVGLIGARVSTAQNRFRSAHTSRLFAVTGRVATGMREEKGLRARSLKVGPLRIPRRPEEVVRNVDTGVVDAAYIAVRYEHTRRKLPNLSDLASGRPAAGNDAPTLGQIAGAVSEVVMEAGFELASRAVQISGMQRNLRGVDGIPEIAGFRLTTESVARLGTKDEAEAKMHALAMEVRQRLATRFPKSAPKAVAQAA